MGELSEYRQPHGKFAFHETDPENRESIRKHGIQRTEDSGVDITNIDTVLQELGYTDPFPFDRTEATYCHLDVEYIQEANEEFGTLISAVTVVVAVDEISAPMYLADMSLISDLIEYLYDGSTVMFHADSPEEIVRRYRKSITPVESVADICADSTDRNHTELVIDGDIPPSAIIEICSIDSQTN